MLDRAAVSLIGVAAACACAAIAVLAGAFALYAVLEPSFGTAGAAAAVALGASLSVGAFAFLHAQRAGARMRNAEAAKTELMHDLQALAGAVAEKHPIAAILASLVGGVIAAGSPRLVNDLATVAAQLWKRPPSP